MGYKEELVRDDDEFTESTLKFAEKICDKYNIISIQEHGKIYLYKESGVYECIASPKVTGSLENLILQFPRGRMWSPAKRKNIIHNINTITYHSTESLNPDGFINFKNGIFNFYTKEFIEHTPDKFFTIQLPYNYNKDSMSEEWEQYLKTTLDNDLNKIKLLQEFCGYCFLKTCKFEKALFLEGGGGAGKSTFTETFRHVIGIENCSATSLINLADPVLRCSIRDKYVNFDSDLPEKAQEYEEIFKKISSGEAIKFNEKFLPSIDETVQCKLIFNVNDFPYVNDSTSAFYRRMILVKFDNQFDDDSADVNLKQRLKKPDNLSGIFNWCMEGLDRLIKNDKFSSNIEMKNHIFELRKENNPILQFIDDKIVFKQDVCVPKQETWDIYKKWSVDNGHKHHLSFKKFNKKLFEEIRRKGAKQVQKTFGDRVRGWSCIDIEDLTFDKKWSYSGVSEIEQTNIKWED